MTGKSLHQTLLTGIADVHSRDDGSVHTIKVEGKAVAEVCVGKRNTRINFRAKQKAVKGIELTGKSKTWAGGGTVVTDENVEAIHKLLVAVATPTASDAAAAQASASKDKQTAQTRVTRSTSKAKAASAA